MRMQFAKLQALWLSRTLRERVLVGALGLILIGLFGWLALYRPAALWRDVQAERLEAAVEQQASVERAAVRWRARSEATHTASASETTLDGLLANTAEAAGLTPEISEDGGQWTVTVAASSSAPIFAWLATLEHEHGVRPIGATLERTPAGLDARLAFSSR